MALPTNVLVPPGGPNLLKRLSSSSFDSKLYTHNADSLTDDEPTTPTAVRHQVNGFRANAAGARRDANGLMSRQSSAFADEPEPMYQGPGINVVIPIGARVPSAQRKDLEEERRV